MDTSEALRVKRLQMVDPEAALLQMDATSIKERLGRLTEAERAALYKDLEEFENANPNKKNCREVAPLKPSAEWRSSKGRLSL